MSDLAVIAQVLLIRKLLQDMGKLYLDLTMYLLTFYYRMGSKTSLTNKPLVVPGAGTYDTPEKPPNMKSAPRFGFGSSTREGFKTLSVPGPGNYAAKTYTGSDGPTFSMGALTTYQPK